jgi:Arc/MetJ family transcription regulator
MLKRAEIEVDDDLVHEAIRRYGLCGRREAVHLALNILLSETDGTAGQSPEDEYDEFSDPNAWQPHRNGHGG